MDFLPWPRWTEVPCSWLCMGSIRLGPPPCPPGHGPSVSHQQSSNSLTVYACWSQWVIEQDYSGSQCISIVHGDACAGDIGVHIPCERLELSFLSLPSWFPQCRGNIFQLVNSNNRNPWSLQVCKESITYLTRVTTLTICRSHHGLMEARTASKRCLTEKNYRHIMNTHTHTHFTVQIGNYTRAHTLQDPPSNLSHHPVHKNIKQPWWHNTFHMYIYFFLQ